MSKWTNIKTLSSNTRIVDKKREYDANKLINSLLYKTKLEQAGAGFVITRWCRFFVKSSSLFAV